MPFVGKVLSCKYWFVIPNRFSGEESAFLIPAKVRQQKNSRFLARSLRALRGGERLGMTMN
jgi:hypothetical protein